MVGEEKVAKKHSSPAHVKRTDSIKIGLNDRPRKPAGHSSEPSGENIKKDLHGPGKDLVSGAPISGCPVRLARPRTQGFHPCNRGSNPLRDATFEPLLSLDCMYLAMGFDTNGANFSRKSSSTSSFIVFLCPLN